MSILEKLSEPFDPDSVKWRPGSMSKDNKSTMALAYLDARDVMDRLDEVCGLGWQCKYSHAGSKTICDIGILIEDNQMTRWIWRADGAGDTDIEGAKGGLSDAFKRAAVRFGIGRYLYDTPNTWVKVDQYKRIESYELKRLAATIGGNQSHPLKSKGLASHNPSEISRSGEWQGPMPAMRLKAETKDMMQAIQEQPEMNDLTAYLKAETVSAIFSQLEHDLPDWFIRANEVLEEKLDELKVAMATGLTASTAFDGG